MSGYEFGEGLWMHFTPHGTVADAEGIEPMLRQATVYIPELALAGPKIHRQYGRLAAGDYKAYTEFMVGQAGNDFMLAVAGMLYARPRKPKLAIEIVDVPAGPQWTPRILRLQRLMEGVAWSDTLEGALAAHEESLKSEAAIQSTRDDYMADKLAKLMTRLEAAPETPRVLMTIGVLHRLLLDKVIERGIAARSTRPTDQIIYSPRDLAIFAFMKGSKPTADQLVTSLLDYFIYAVNPALTDDEAIQKTAAVTADLSLDEKYGIAEELVEYINLTGDLEQVNLGNLVVDLVGMRKAAAQA